MTQEFRTCACGHILDVYRHERGEESCACAKERPVSEFPFADHMRAALEPYIVWREDQALGKFILKQAESATEVRCMRCKNITDPFTCRIVPYKGVVCVKCCKEENKQERISHVVC